ncbi:MAG: type III pantothenate kinase [Chloroflexi bacterium CFX4]|nr:type III pantothenate kinase [Chloroflexi bacterium CFX4]MDL1922693.1 type III pantothenate kinase [Chloroflexi bacterium CFX3]
MHIPERTALLAIDIGNTNITLGLWYGGAWRHDWRARTVHDKMPDEYAALLRSFLRDAGLSYAVVSDVVIASVVPPLTHAFGELTRKSLGIAPLIINARTPLGIQLEVDNPEQVGADRIVNAAAVHQLYGGPAIVIDFGTATTFDIISRQGNYIGGSIAPGIGIAHDALVRRAAQLYKVELAPPPSPIGRNTTHAIQSGLFLGYVCMVEGLVNHLKAAMPEGAQAKVIATGGLASLFQQHTAVIEIIAPTLTLDGLRLIYELNAPTHSAPQA